MSDQSHAPTSAFPSVPAEYQGVWRRTLLRSADGAEDTTTRVFWLQTARHHVDIRVPAERPSLGGATSLAELNREQLNGLALQQGFGGVTEVKGDVCQWTRQADFQPPTGDNDIGRMVFKGRVQVLEYGVESDYFEDWAREPGSDGDSFALERLSDDGKSPTVPLTRLLVAGGKFMYIRARHGDTLPKSASFSELAANLSDDELRRALDFEISYGSIDSPGPEPRRWIVDLSTLPWREGEAALSSEAFRNVLKHAPGEVVSESGDNEGSKWRILDLTQSSSSS